MKWHPISENPKEDGIYLVFAPSADPAKPFRHIAFYDTDHGWQGLVSVWLNALTHWAPFPDPPKE